MAALIFVCSVLVQKVTCAYIPNHIIILESQRTTASFQAIHNSYYTRRIQSIPNYSSFQSFCGDSRTSCGWQSPRAETTQHHSRRSKNNHHNPQLYTQYSLRPTPSSSSFLSFCSESRVNCCNTPDWVEATQHIPGNLIKHHTRQLNQSHTRQQNPALHQAGQPRIIPVRSTQNHTRQFNPAHTRQLNPASYQAIQSSIIWGYLETTITTQLVNYTPC